MEKPNERPQPSPAELEILQVLWKRGSSTVRGIWEELKGKGVRYTTVLKQLQVMAQKGMVERDDAQRTHLYRPAIAQDEAQRKLTADFLDRVFVGSAEQLVLRALEVTETSPEE
ncbi:MAG: BlaI/MecI/CopY family transcriptional regulator [FCB group bacterium]|jgi:predicted transcriptional regulator|nr:BlaI/MecI/CopY family transcriptional regulator [FCB group bacterium]